MILRGSWLSPLDHSSFSTGNGAYLPPSNLLESAATHRRQVEGGIPKALLSFYNVTVPVCPNWQCFHQYNFLTTLWLSMNLIGVCIIGLNPYSRFFPRPYLESGYSKTMPFRFLDAFLSSWKALWGTSPGILPSTFLNLISQSIDQSIIH